MRFVMLGIVLAFPMFDVYVTARFARWTAREDALVGSRSDSEVGRIIGRTREAVKQRRGKLGRAPSRVAH